MMGRLGRIWIGVALAVAVVLAGSVVGLLGARDAEAHAALIRANPSNGEQVARPPTRVILEFSEPLERRLTTIEVTDVDSNRVDEGDVQFDDSDPKFASIALKDLDPGLYIVEFNNVSTVDGHPWRGVTQFIVLNPDGTVPEGAQFDPNASVEGGGTTGLLPRNVDIIAKWIALLSVTITAGAAFWVLAVGRPSGNFLEEDDYQAATDHVERSLVRIGHVLLPIGFIAMAVLVLVTVNRFETPTSLGEYLVSIQAGRYRALYGFATIAALIGIDLLFLARSARLRTSGLLLTLAALLVALFTFSLTSHSGVGAGSFWATTSDYIHLLASAIWLGMLVMLVPFLLWARRGLAEQERFLYSANIFDRFSIVATISVVVVMTTGVFNGLVQLPSWSAWVDTTYGRVLLAKMVLIAPLLAIAGLNALVLKPRLVETIDGVYQKGGTLSEKERDAAHALLARLQRVLPVTIAIEVAFVIAVLASVAVLTQTSTAEGELAAKAAEEQSGDGFRDQKPAGDLQLSFVVSPNTVGLNRFNLTLREENGTLVEDASQVRLRFFYNDPENPDLNTGQSELLLDNFGPGEYRGGGAFLSQPGTWRVEAGIRREGEDDVSRNFVVAVRPPEGEEETEGGRFAMPFTALGWNEVTGAGFVIVGGLVLLYGASLSRGLALDRRWMATIAAALIIGGGTLIYAIEGGQGGTDEFASRNPIAPTDESVAAGRMLFQRNCIVCHGVNGRGDGPQAASLNPPPTDFRLHLPLHADPQFFAFIANGYPASAMPAWRDSLTDDEIWNLVNFMRSEFDEAPSVEGSR